MQRITFLPGNITVEAEEGSPLLEAARRAGVYIETPCGGKGTCQKCRVKLHYKNSVQEVLICQTKIPDGQITVEMPEALSAPGQFENFDDPEKYIAHNSESPGQDGSIGQAYLKKITFSAAKPEPLDGLSDADRFSLAFIKALNSEQMRLSQEQEPCRSVELPLSLLAALPEKLREADGTVTAFFYIENAIAKTVEIITSTALSKSPISHSQLPTPNSPPPIPYYGIAVDIGTTTVALWLVDLESGKVVSAHNAYNSQIECGADVISRINYAKKGLGELRSKILETVNNLIDSACGDAKISPDRILCVSLAGNTTMTHLFLGITSEYIRLSPYTPAVFRPQVYTAGQTGIRACENAPVLFAPAVGSYVGGDITAGLLCTSLAAGPNDAARSDSLILFIDIGTNGEIVLGNGEFILACACSAGPAFEGGGIKHGIRARAGAIERVELDADGKPLIHTIGGVTPNGICGSGIISAVAELFRKGVIDSAGKFPRKNGEFVLCESSSGAPEITIGETDIDNFIRAKGAIFSACQTLLESVGLSFTDLDRLYVAGGFGRFLDLEDARTVGLLPRLPNEKYVFAGNTSVIGAYLCLVSEERRAKMRELATKITYIDLSSEPGYMNHYTGALFLPHTDQKLFM